MIIWLAIALAVTPPLALAFISPRLRSRVAPPLMTITLPALLIAHWSIWLVLGFCFATTILVKHISVRHSYRAATPLAAAFLSG